MLMSATRYQLNGTVRWLCHQRTDSALAKRLTLGPAPGWDAALEL